MNKAAYIAALRQELLALPESEREAAVLYYSEYFDDAGPEQEEAVAAELGSPEEVARNILNSVPGVPEPLYRQRTNAGSSSGSNAAGPTEAGRNRSHAGYSGYDGNKTEKTVLPAASDNSGIKLLLVIVLAVITIPVWVPLVCSVAGILFALIVAAVAVAAGLTVAALAILAAGVALSVLSFVFWPGFLPVLLLCGTGLMLAGAGLICVTAGIWVFAQLFPRIIRGIVYVCRLPFNKRGNQK